MPLTRASTGPSENATTEEVFRSELAEFRIEIRSTIHAAISAAIAPLSASVTALTAQVAAMESKLLEKETRIKQLDSTNQLLRERVESMELATDNLDQYGRRMNFRVENIPFTEGETIDSLGKQVLGILEAVGAPVDPKDVVRLHRSTPLRSRENVCAGVKCSQVIVRVGTWKTRERVHLARNAARAKGLHLIRQDLTKPRRDLLTKANDAIRDFGATRVPVWAYANINCQPVLRQGKEVRRFSTESELRDALDHFLR